MKTQPETFEGMKDWAMRYLHDALLRGGAAEMRAALHAVLVHAIQWSAQEQEAEKRKKK